MKYILSIFLSCLSLFSEAQTGVYCYNTLPAGRSLHPSNFTEYNHKLYFFGTDSLVSGRELWVLDSVNSPTLAVDFKAGTAFGAPSVHYGFLGMYPLNGKLYVSLDSSTTGLELYAYDGINRPMLAADITPGTGYSEPFGFASLNGKLYFRASVTNYDAFLEFDPMTSTIHQPKNAAGISAGGIELTYTLSMPSVNKIIYNERGGAPSAMVFDAARDTVIYADSFYAINPGGEYNPSVYLMYNNKAYFSAVGDKGRELYVYDGISNNLPSRLTDVNPGTGNGFENQNMQMAVYNGSIYFSGNDGTTGFQLYKYDITANTSSMVYKINPSGNASPNYLTILKNKLYFSANDGTHGTELWVYDFINQPHMVTDIYPGSGSSFPVELATYAGNLYFSAGNPATGQEVYRLADTSVGINTPYTDTVLCSGQNLLLNYTTSNNFGTGNTFTAQLSDATGSFASPVTIGTTTSATSGNITCVIPTSTPAGSNYHIRIVSSNPVTISEYVVAKIGSVAPHITLTATPSVINFLDTVNFTTIIVNGGATPTYQWLKNGSIITGVTTPTYKINTLNNNDKVCVILTSSIACASPTTDSSCKIIATGVNDLSAANSFKVYPNPNKGSFTLNGLLTTNKEVTIEVLNRVGQTMYKETARPVNKELNKQINLKNVADGIYLLQITAGDEKKLIKLTVTQ